MTTKMIIGEPAATGNRAIGDGTAMQLAAATYCSIGGNVKKTVKKNIPGWDVVWEPVKAIGGNYAFIAFNGVQYVVAIRGSILDFSIGSFQNWFEEDFNIFTQVAWTFPANSTTKPMISTGASDGLNNLMALTDAKGDTILSYLMNHAIPGGKFLCVTGHSLGGNLATVFAPWLLYQIKQAGKNIPAIFSVLTFAAPTAWNAAFADQFNLAFTNSWRYINSIDIVPFSACDVEGLAALYPAPLAADGIFTVVDGVKVTLAEAFDGIGVAVAVSEIANGSVYSIVNQGNRTIVLNTAGQIFPVNTTKPLIEQWFDEASAQHSHDNYLTWLGAKSFTCEL